MTVHTKHVDATTYVSERRHVGTRGLEQFLNESTRRLEAIAETLGGPTGPRTTIFHGPVSDEEDGEVQNALPVSNDITGENLTEPTVLLLEPACECAYTRVDTTRFRYPAILSAYDEVYEWLTHHGYTPTLAPREIYLTDPATAGPDDDICDIAVPFIR